MLNLFWAIDLPSRCIQSVFKFLRFAEIESKIAFL